MIRFGIVAQLYAKHVEGRPFSRFTAKDEEIAENADWRCRALTWASTHVDEHGHFSQTGEYRMRLKGHIYYASKRAKRDCYYKEQQSVTLTNYHSTHYLSEHFVEVNLDESGQSYVHLTLS